jgi:citrate lyase subunit beta/citryl-CoA lyase
MMRRVPALRRTWLFGAGADRAVHAAMTASGADVLIHDLEDFTPPNRRIEARSLAAELYAAWHAAGAEVVVRINSLDTEGLTDLDAVMPAKPDCIAYPKAGSAHDIRTLHAEIGKREASCGYTPGSIEILPVCETAAGVVNLREIAAASPRVRCALLGAEDLAADLCAERGADGVELDYARRRFVFDCRAARIEPVDAPYTYADAEGAVREAIFARRIGYRCKSLVRADHTAPLNAIYTPDVDECTRALRLIAAFDAGRAKGEDRVLFEEQWVEVPTYLNAKRMIERAQAFGLIK